VFKIVEIVYPSIYKLLTKHEIFLRKVSRPPPNHLNKEVFRLRSFSIMIIWMGSKPQWELKSSLFIICYTLFRYHYSLTDITAESVGLIFFLWQFIVYFSFGIKKIELTLKEKLEFNSIWDWFSSFFQKVKRLNNIFSLLRLRKPFFIALEIIENYYRSVWIANSHRCHIECGLRFVQYCVLSYIFIIFHLTKKSRIKWTVGFLTKECLPLKIT
jgi:hypothetical protein